MKIAACPYCGSEDFKADAVRADAIDAQNPGRYGKEYGHWFNQCSNCDEWSIHKDGNQLKLPAKDRGRKPREGSQAAIK